MLELYILNNPAYLNMPQPFQVGFIDTDGSLTDVTSDVTIDILSPNGATIVDTNKLVVNSTLQDITVEFAISYLDYPVLYTEFSLVQNLKQVTQANILNTFLKYLPKNVYTNSVSGTSPVYCDNTATTTALAQIYDNSAIANPAFTDLNTVVDTFFPDSGNPAWEQYLVGTNSLYLQTTTDYPALLQLFYQTNINNNTNPYFLAYNISQYIYYRLGEQYYVYIGENAFDAFGAFILNLNQLGHCVLSGTTNGSTPTSVIIYIMDGSGLSTEFQQELTLFVRRIMRAGDIVTVDFDHTFSDFGLIDISNTYWKDPRQDNSYCIAYNQNVLAQALGYSGGGTIQDLVSFTVSLIPGGETTSLILGETYQVVITPVFSTPTTLPLPVIQYTEFFCSDSDIINFYMDDGVEYFHANSLGECTMTIYLGTLYQTITYNVVSGFFELDISELDIGVLA